MLPIVLAVLVACAAAQDNASYVYGTPGAPRAATRFHSRATGDYQVYVFNRFWFVVSAVVVSRGGGVFDGWLTG